MADLYDQELSLHQLASNTGDASGSTDLLTRFSDAATKGVAGAAVSGTLSIVNSFVDSQDTGTTEDVLRNMNWDSAADYYTQNKQIIDTAGFIGSSIATYGAGTMLLKAARAGSMLGPLSGYLRMAPDANKTALAEAIGELAAPGGSMMSKIGRTTYQRLGWSVADNILTAAAGETMTLAVLRDSPMLDGYSASDFLINAVGFGALGGGVEFLAGRAIVRRAASVVDMAANEYKGIGTGMAAGLAKQNEILVLADDLTGLKADFGKTKFDYTYGGESRTLDLNTEKLFQETRDATVKRGLEDLSLKMNELADNNINVGQAFSKRALDVLARMGDTPEARAAARDELAGLLTPIGKLVSLNDVDKLADEGSAIYFRNADKLKEGESIYESAHTFGKTNKQPYKLAEGVDASTVEVASAGGKYANQSAAFNDGVDVWYTKLGVPKVNPQSERLIATSDALITKTGTIHIETGDHSYNPVYSIGDDIRNPKSDVILPAKADSITISGRQYRQAATEPLPFNNSTRDSSTRYVYASQLNDKHLNKLGHIDAQDLPLMDRLVELGVEKIDPDLQIRLMDGTSTAIKDIPYLGMFRQQQKLAWLVGHFDELGSIPSTELAVHLNTSEAWVRSAISRNFARGPELETGILRTVQAAEPRSVGVKFSKQDQIFRGTDSTGAKISGALGRMTAAGKVDVDELAKIVGLPKADLIATAKASGDPKIQVVATELGRTIDRALSDVAKPAISKEAQEELIATSRKFNPESWTTPGKMKAGLESVIGDNMAVWMTQPSKRADMSEFARLYTDKLQPYEQFFKQQIWQRTNGPTLGADAMLSHQYELRMRTALGQNASRSVNPELDDRLLPVDPAIAKRIDSLGSGASQMGASNAGYGSGPKLWAQYTGKVVNEFIGKLQNATAGELRGGVQAVIASPEASAELGTLVNAVRRSDSKFHLVTVHTGESGEALERPLTKFVSDATKKLLDSDPSLDAWAALSRVEAQGQYAELPVRSQAVRDFLVTHSTLNDNRQDKLQVLWNSIGLGNKRQSGTLYIPPIDTTRYPHIAFVKQKPGIGACDEVAMITAKDADQLRALMSRVPDGYDVHTKDSLERFFQAKGSYDYSHFITDTRTSSEMRKRGVLGDFFTETRGENVLADFTNFHARQDELLVRKQVEVKYSDLFSQLKYLSDDFTAADRSVARGKLAIFQNKIADPYNDYIKTALDISKRQEFPLLDKVNDFVDNIGRKMGSVYEQAIRDAKAANTMVSWEDANKVAERYGLGNTFEGVVQKMYTDNTTYLKANEAVPKNVIANITHKMNSLMSTLGLRLDFANSLVNILSTPIMLGMEHASIKKLASSDPELVGKLAELYHTQMPGSQVKVPSYTKMLFTAMNNYFKDEGQLMTRYRGVAGISDALDHHKMMLQDMTYQPWEAVSALGNRVDNWVEKAGKFTGNQFAEQFTRFISADVMRQQTDLLVSAGKMSLQEADAYISTFVNRVQGNYVQSQRPVVFQGTAGRAVSLFQTYIFNVAQQVLRHVEDKNTKALMTFGMLQSSVYGLNGLPYFDAINTHLIGNLSSNPTHQDVGSVLNSGNSVIGNWLMYGTASAFPLFDGHGPALYSRGDLNPRTLMGLPTQFQDIPAVSGSIKAVNSVIGFGSTLAKGGDVGNSLLLAMEHQGMSRPLAGLAQVLSGRTTTSKGDLIAASNELSVLAQMSTLHPKDIVEAGTGVVTRLAGAKPFDTAVAVDQLWKQSTYKLEDKARIAELGEAVKTKLYNNQVPTDDEYQGFLTKYTAAGGVQRSFAQEMQRWMKNANHSVVNQMSEKLGRQGNQKLHTLMGGEELPDYTNQGVADPGEAGMAQ